MKTKQVILSIIIVSAFLSGCAKKSEIDSLRNNLGDSQYLALKPKLKVSVLKRELVKPESEYSSPVLKLTGVVQQQGDFPVSRYNAGIKMGVYIDSKEVDTVYLNVEIKGANGVFSEDLNLYTMKDSILPKASRFTLKIKSFEWYPVNEDLSGIELEVKE